MNAAIVAAGGSERAFWLGMFEDGDVPDKNGAKDSDGNPLSLSSKPIFITQIMASFVNRNFELYVKIWKRTVLQI